MFAPGDGACNVHSRRESVVSSSDTAELPEHQRRRRRDDGRADVTLLVKRRRIHKATPSSAWSLTLVRTGRKSTLDGMNQRCANTNLGVAGVEGNGQASSSRPDRVAVGFRGGVVFSSSDETAARRSEYRTGVFSLNSCAVIPEDRLRDGPCALDCPCSSRT